MSRQDNQSFKERQKDNSSDPNLHPSWAAKKKAKSEVVQFQGKRTVFDDAGEGGGVKEYTSGGKEYKSEAKKSTGGGEEKGLHPSWAAKQSQKAKILPFQGKKTVFED